jgi:hypothetical protein
MFLFVAGCNSGGGGGGCGIAGQGCAGNSCCAGLTCTNGVCGTINQCAMSGASCASVSCCAGLQCINGTCGTTPQCATTGQSCGTTQCCSGLTCTNGTCAGTDTRKNFGAGPCTSPNDCKTNQCLAFQGFSTEGQCTVGCTNSATCAQQSTSPYWCVQLGSTGGTSYCLRQCATGTDCADLGNDWSCDVELNTEGMLYGVCAVYKNLAEGVSCTEDQQCASGTCNVAWCSSMNGCFSDADCGSFAVCAKSAQNQFRCFPRCTTTTDCDIFVRQGFSPTCNPASDVDGTTTVNVCSS